jgi:hypothetical protein
MVLHERLIGALTLKPSLSQWHARGDTDQSRRGMAATKAQAAAAAPASTSTGTTAAAATGSEDRSAVQTICLRMQAMNAGNVAGALGRCS